MSGTRRATLRFSGYEWEVKSGERVGPGPNRWDAENAFTDREGRLHLRIRRTAAGVWSCAEVGTVARLGFGTYEFQISGPVGRLDPNIVLGLFHYPPRDVGADGTNEIDIEFARWGNAKYPNGNYTVWPARKGVAQTSHTFPVPPDLTETTHRYTWQPDRIVLQSLRGFSRNPSDDRGEFARWEFHPQNPEAAIARQPMPVRLNLWLFRAVPPTDSKEVEITIVRFTHKPFN